jgi:cell wall-associated NlpC family hydrolase
MADTPIAGAQAEIGQETSAGVSASSSTGDPFSSAGGNQDIIDTPMPAWSNPSYDQFQDAVTQGSTTPGGFARVQAGDDEKLSGTRSDLVNYAKKFLGTPYVWGGSQPGGFDCSGFVQYVEKKFGIDLPRVSYQQANSGTRTSIKNLQAGDLVAWDENSRNNGADHIAIYIGNGYIIEAPHTGANVRIRKLGKNEGAWGVSLNIGK